MPPIFRSHCVSSCPSQPPTPLFAVPRRRQPCRFSSLFVEPRPVACPFSNFYFLVGRWFGGCSPPAGQAGSGGRSLPEARSSSARSRPLSSTAVKRRSRYSQRRKSCALFCPLSELHSKQQETRLR